MEGGAAPIGLDIVKGGANVVGIDVVGCVKVVLEMRGLGRLIDGLYGIREGG